MPKSERREGNQAPSPMGVPLYPPPPDRRSELPPDTMSHGRGAGSRACRALRIVPGSREVRRRSRTVAMVFSCQQATLPVRCALPSRVLSRVWLPGGLGKRAAWDLVLQPRPRPAPPPLVVTLRLGPPGDPVLLRPLLILPQAALAPLPSSGWFRPPPC